MEKEKIIELALTIIELDMERDERYERLMKETNGRGAELLRYLQNTPASSAFASMKNR